MAVTSDMPTGAAVSPSAGRLALASLLGAILLAAIQAYGEWAAADPYVGEFIYNYYFLSLIEGRLDIPAQIAGLEGFYDAEGRAFLYHGIGPLVTRVLAWPFVDLTVVDLRAPSIWLYAAIGASGFYWTAVSLLRPWWPTDRAEATSLHLLVWVMTWLLAPGLVLVSNGSFFHEPIAFAFAMQGLGLYALYRFIDSGFDRYRWICAAAVFAGLAVHARPHVAVGLYLAIGLVGLYALYRHRAQALLPGFAVMAILGAFGAAYLGLNALRFGSPGEISGSVAEDAAIIYGFRFWGWEAADSARVLSTQKYGSFHAGRILPNLFFYALSMGDATTVKAFARMTADVGYVRLEQPVVAFVLLWLPFCLLAAAPLFWLRGPRAFLLTGLALAVPGALVMLAYTTNTLRYKIELWPVVFVLGIVGLVGLLRTRSGEARAGWLKAVRLCAAVALVANVWNSQQYIGFMTWDWGWYLRSYEDCAARVSELPKLGPERVSAICVLDRPDG